MVTTFFLQIGTTTNAPAQTTALVGPKQVRAAAAFAAERRGSVSFAVIDARGRLHHRGGTRRYQSASVTKALLLVAALRQVGDGRPVPPGLARDLDPMIRLSGNRAAHRVYRRVGADAALQAVARRAGMRRIGTNGTWSNVLITAVDVARFFRAADRLTPRRHRAYARRLLTTVVGRQSWGIPRVARPAGWDVRFKGGWRRGIIHQGAVAERDGRRVALAVLTDENPSHDYGTFTVAGIARRLLTATGESARTPAR